MERTKEKFTMKNILERETLFTSFPYARCATDGRFQQANRLSNMCFEEAWSYFSFKHKLYDYKTKVSVIPNWLAICSTLPSRDMESDFRYFEKT